MNDGKEKIAVVRSKDKRKWAFHERQTRSPRKNFSKPDPTSHVFKIAKGADSLSTPLKNGDVHDLKY